MNELMQNLLKLQMLEFGEQKETNAAGLIEELRRKIPQQILAHYDRLAVRGKKGVAAVRNQVCTGCHMRVPLGVIMTLKHEEDIQLCDNCGRYLHLSPDDSGGATELAQSEAASKPQRKKKNATRAAA